MHEENEEVTEFVIEETPEICAEMEPVINDTEFLRKLKIEYDKAKEILFK